MDDLEITFNPVSFTNAMKEIVKSITIFEGKMELVRKVGSFAFQGIKNVIGGAFNAFRGSMKGVEKESKKTVDSITSWGIAKGMIMANVLTSAFKKGFAQIPEIGRSMSIAGQIISKNLLWPLRKELIPLLQGMLNWVRDHRAMFVRWGQIIANVFRAIKDVVMGFYNVVKKVFSQLFSGLERIFGKSKNTIEQMLNILIFKITGVAMFIQMALEPVLSFIVSVILSAIEAFKHFGDAFMKVVGDISPMISDLWESFKSLGESLSALGGGQEEVNSLFSKLGTIVGMVLLPVFTALVEVIDLLVSSLASAADGYRYLKAAMAGDELKMKEIDERTNKRLKEYKERAAKRWSHVGTQLEQGMEDLSGGGGMKQAVGSASKVTSMASVLNKNETNNQTIYNNISAPSNMSKEDFDSVMTNLLKKQQRLLGKQGG